MFFAASTLIKISMTLFNRRLTGMTSDRWQIVHYSFLTLLVIWFFITLFINIFQCTPVTAFFNFSLQVDTPSYRCLDTNKINFAFVIINAGKSAPEDPILVSSIVPDGDKLTES